MVSSPTGSGKTAAFMLPAIERFSQLQKAQASQPREPRPADGARNTRRPQPVARPTVLVLTPTRELAMQVTTAAATYGKHLERLRTVSILGGVAVWSAQLMLLAKNPEILVATPGRLIDHLERGRIDLSQLQILVLDEADRVLDMGFIEDIETIVAATPATRRTLLFSGHARRQDRFADGPSAQRSGAYRDRSALGATREHRASRPLRGRPRSQGPSARPSAARLRRPRTEAHRSSRRPRWTPIQLAGRLADAGFESGRTARRPAAGRVTARSSALREASRARAGGHRRRRSRHRHSGHHARVQLRLAEVRCEGYVHRIGRTGPRWSLGRHRRLGGLVHHAEQGRLGASSASCARLAGGQVVRFRAAQVGSGRVTAVAGFRRRPRPSGAAAFVGGVAAALRPAASSSGSSPGGNSGGWAGKPAGSGSREGYGGSRDGGIRRNTPQQSAYRASRQLTDTQRYALRKAMS